MVSSPRRQSKTTRVPSKPRKAAMSTAKRRKRMQASKKQLSKPKPWWDPEQLFLVEYISNARLVTKGRSRVWVYEVKWWGYKMEENSHEFASEFTKCEYPILYNFWKSVGQAGEEPDPKRYKGKQVVFDSPGGYRCYETDITKRMAKSQENGVRIGVTDPALSDTSDSSGEELSDAYAKPTTNGKMNPRDTILSKEQDPLRKNAGFKPGRGKTY